ncbi:MAG: SDR family oxidoreductase [Kiritimatiellae bacterium]|nr:SDR family oxidoreductase [Verrucomicrobiota bacterium]MBU4367133.1 SDR family oxidoreductase [Verrucomicrobiota bacterium]MCG2659624.1 SDR family oxidoreductase [Kiritimatiellia bacterium]
MSIIDTFSLNGKVALVTGGAGLYGRQIVQALAEAGARTYIASRNLEALEKLAAEHRALGHDVRALRLDQADEPSIFAVRDAIVKESGRPHILVNNAVARPVTKGYFDDAAVINESMRVNGTGLILVTRAMGEVLADSGSIINIGSIMGLIGLEPLNYRNTDMEGWAPDYFFHKGGMANLTRFLASYYGPRGIRVNCVHPGGLRSPSHPEAFVKNYSERTCLSRLASDTDLMGIIVFLASDASAYITGTNIPVDGGYTAK